ncbi:hypothetical protein OBBRIDRAFT_817242, partial [Obba rivulosa]
MAGGFGDDVIHDSEDEDYLSMPPAAQAKVREEIVSSSIQTAQSSHLPSALPLASSPQTNISAFTTSHNTTRSLIEPDTSWASDVSPGSAPKPAGRPRPRPIQKGSAAYHAALSSLENVQQDPLLITPRNTISTTNRISSPLPASSRTGDTEPASEAPEPSYSYGVAERAKLRARSHASKTQKSLALADDTVGLSSDEGESALKKSATKKKTKLPRDDPFLKAAQPKAGRASSSTAAPQSSELAPVEIIDLITQLPPSDPPLYSSSGVPAGSPPAPPAPVAVHEDDLASPLVNAARKRKRPRPYNALEDDSDGVDDFLLKPPKAKEIALAAPPPFFVGSSQPSEAPVGLPVTAPSSGNLNIEAGPSSPVSKPKPSKKRGKRDDDGDEDWAAETRPKSKVKSRKKVAVSDDEEWDQAAVSKRGKKGKGKSDGKPNGKTAKKKKESPRKTVEVVIDRQSPPKGPHVTFEDEALGIVDASVAFDIDLTPPPPSPSNRDPSPALLPSPTKVAHIERPDSGSGNSPAGTKEQPGTKGKKRNASSSNPTSSNSTTHNLAEDDDDSPICHTSKGKGKKRAVAFSDDEHDAEPSAHASPSSAESSRTKRRREEKETTKENQEPTSAASFIPARPAATPASVSKISGSSRTHSIAPGKLTPMSELIRKVNSLPGSPFASPRPTYSPYLKASKSVLKRIAPLHPNRRTPPPPPPRPPPPKKTKKQIELEEKWEMELEESVD